MKIKQYADTDLAEEIRAAIEKNNGHCPCVLKEFQNQDTKCMCKNFRESPIGTICNCGLYIKLKN